MYSSLRRYVAASLASVMILAPTPVNTSTLQISPVHNRNQVTIQTYDTQKGFLLNRLFNLVHNAELKDTVCEEEPGVKYCGVTLHSESGDDEYTFSTASLIGHKFLFIIDHEKRPCNYAIGYIVKESESFKDDQLPDFINLHLSKGEGKEDASCLDEVTNERKLYNDADVDALHKGVISSLEKIIMRYFGPNNTKQK